MKDFVKELFCRYRKRTVKGCGCCCGEEFLVKPNSRGTYALVTSKGKLGVVNEGTYLVFDVKYCPNCGRRFKNVDSGI